MHPWTHIIRFVEQWDGFPSRETALRFLKQAQALGLEQYFRAGSSHFRLLFSAGVIYPDADPRVTLIFRQTDELILVAYGDGFVSEGRRREAEVFYLLAYDEAFATFLRFLKQAWINTMPAAVPAVLSEIQAPALMRESRSLFEMLGAPEPSRLLS